MTKQDLLTKLAKECATWEAASLLGRAEACSQSQNDPNMSAINITKHEWLAERDKLLDKPNWNDAPEGTACIAMDKVGLWRFFSKKPTRLDTQWMPESPDAWQVAGFAYTIPAGYDWRESLEEHPVHSNSGRVGFLAKQSIMNRFLMVK